MDLSTINIIVSLLSGAMILISVVYMMIYILGSFSSRSGSMSSKVVLLTLLYFFGTTIPMWLGVEWLMQVARSRVANEQPFFLNIGASALALNAMLHILCGFLTIFLYVRGQMSQGITLRRVLDDIRDHLRPKTRK